MTASDPLGMDGGPPVVAASPPSPCSSDAERRSLHSVGRGTAWMILGTALLFLFTLLSRVLLARSVSAVEWGEFSLGVAVVGLVTVLALLGLDQASARMLSFERDRAARRAIVVKGVVLAATTGTIASVAVYLLAPWLAQWFHAPGFAWLLQLLSVTVGFAVMTLMLAALFQGLEDARPNALFNQVLNPGLFLAFVALGVALHVGFPVIMAGYVLANASALIALAVFAARRLPREVPRVPGPLPRVPQLWTFAAALWGVGTLYYVTAFVDTLIVGVFWPVAVVGVYAADINLARVLLVGNNALTFIFLPVAARLARDGDVGTLRSTYLAGTRWINLLTTPAVLVFCLLPGATLTEVYGPGFGSGAAALVVLAAASFASIALGPANASLAGLGETRWLFAATVVSGATNLGLSLALIPRYGLLGAAVAWSVARIAYPSVAAARLYRGYGVSAADGSLWKPLAFTLVLGAPIAAVLAHGVPPWTIVPLYGIGVALYLVGLVVTRSLQPSDLVLVHSIEGRIGRRLPRTVRFLERHLPAPAPAG